MTDRRPKGPARARNWIVSQLRDMRVDRIAWTVFLFAAATAASVWSQTLGKSITAPLVYLLGVTVIGATQGLFLGLLTAICASAIYNFAITDPVFVFRMADVEDLVPLLAFNLSALISGSLAGRLKDSVAEARKSARDLGDLLEASKLLQSVVTPADLAAAIPKFGPFRGGFQAVLLALAGDALKPVADAEGADARLISDLGDSLREGRLPSVINGWTVHRLDSAHETLGLLLVRPSQARQKSTAAAHLGAFVTMVAITLERCSLLERLASSKAVERSEAFKTALLSSVSHDMRTPLSAITASVSGLIEYEQNLSTDTRAHLLRTIMEQCGRLNRYTTDLLNLGRVQAGLSAEHLAVIDVVEVIGRAINGIRPTLGARDIVKELPVTPVFVTGDATLLEQVVHNVLENAVAYSDDGSSIAVTLAPAHGCAQIAITDQGIGVPESELTRIFARFYRVEHPGHRVRGSGLGLAIAKAFSEAIGGTIHAQSPVADGAGTRIIIELPLRGTT